MINCSKCNSEIKVEKFSENLVEVSCPCQKPRQYLNTGNDDELRQRYRDLTTRLDERIKEKPKVERFELNEELKTIFQKKEFSESNIYEHFPSKFKPRPIQIQLWKEIQSQLKSGYKNIVLCAPTGVGKSLLAASIAKQMRTSFIVTSTKSLQDQYVKDLLEFFPVKGKSNFACFKIMEQKKIPLHEINSAFKKGLTCNKGICQDCSFKPNIQDFVGSEHKKNDCLYYVQKYRGLTSKHSIWSYASYFQIIEQKDKFENFLNRSIAIFDEAHKIEDQMIQFLGITITNAWLTECKINENDYDLADIEKILTLLEDLANSYSDRIKRIKEQNPHNPDYEIIGQFEDKYDRIVNGYKNISANEKNFVINDPKKDSGGNFISISIKPLYIQYYIKKYFQNQYQIFMSATIDKESFCENLGFPNSEVAFIDTPISPFKAENRKISFENITRLNYSSTESDKLLAISGIDDLLTNHKNERGLILTSSKQRCLRIKENLSPPNQKRVTIWHSSNFRKKTMEQILKDHSEKPDSVLLSSSLWEGIDLKDDLSRFQIIEKTPYADMTDKRTSIKMKKIPNWYRSQALIKLLQGFGRSIRNENDWAKTYVIDSAAQDLLNKLRSRVPHSYFDVLGWSK